MRIGIACFPSIGGSGIVATEIGKGLGRLGHSVHFIATDVPWRFDAGAANVHFHRVLALAYPLFPEAPDAIAVAAELVRVAGAERLDVLHVHYALPHAIAGLLAKEALGKSAPRLVVTVHGTELALVRAQPSFLPLVQLALSRSDAITVPSQYLQASTAADLAITAPIEVIPNFVDTTEFAPSATKPRNVVVHSSNFRPVKRVTDVIRVFAALKPGAELVLVGDGPERPAAMALVRELGLQGVSFLGERRDVAGILQRARVFLMPSALEGFGLAALEAQSSGVPVVASRVGGLPEVVGDAGFLTAPGDIAAMTTATQRLLDDDALHADLSARGRKIAVERFEKTEMVRRYEALYRRLLG